MIRSAFHLKILHFFVHFFVSLINIRLFSGLGISKCLTSDRLSDTLSDTLSFLLQNLVLSRVLFMVRQENESVIDFVTSDTLVILR